MSTMTELFCKIAAGAPTWRVGEALIAAIPYQQRKPAPAPAPAPVNVEGNSLHVNDPEVFRALVQCAEISGRAQKDVLRGIHNNPETGPFATDGRIAVFPSVSSDFYPERRFLLTRGQGQTFTCVSRPEEGPNMSAVLQGAIRFYENTPCVAINVSAPVANIIHRFRKKYARPWEVAAGAGWIILASEDILLICQTSSGTHHVTDAFQRWGTPPLRWEDEDAGEPNGYLLVVKDDDMGMETRGAIPPPPIRELLSEMGNPVLYMAGDVLHAAFKGGPLTLLLPTKGRPMTSPVIAARDAQRMILSPMLPAKGESFRLWHQALSPSTPSPKEGNPL